MSLQQPDVLTEAQTLHQTCLVKYQALKHEATTFYSPMVVSKLLMLLKDLRSSLEKLQSLPMKTQEETAWVTLNACKLILDIAQPLIWFNCGKYVVETLTFAALSMEAVINLCTVRHMNFRMKLYSSIFYAVIIQGSTDEAQAIWDHCHKQINELKERELLDPPLPQESIDCLTKCAEDLFILKFILDIWRDNEAIDFTPKGTDKYITLAKDMALAVTKGYTLDTEYFRFRILNETFRIHHLCSGNMNETYLKRSSHMIKAVENILSNIDLENLDENVVSSIYEMAALAILDQDEVPATVHSQLKALVSQLPKANDIEGNFKDKLNFLIQAQEMLSLSHEDSKYLEHLSRFSNEIHRMIFIDSSYHSRSFFGKFAAAIVRKSIYEPLQRLLSSSQPVGHKQLAEIGAGLTFVVKNLESVFTQDSIFFASLITLNVNVLVTVEDFRGAISVARRGLTILEDHRAARVDFHAMLPEDVRDVMALQRQSFTTRSDSSDWYHAVKRLGAHAFAGFGIFGLGSSSDRSDQALAEIHAELLALYFRTELRYGISHYLLRKSLLLKNKEIEMAKAAALKENPNMKTKTKEKEKTIKPGTSKPITAGTVSNLNASVDLSNDSTSVSVQKLPIFNSMKIFCAKNPYAQSILMMEAAKLDQDSSQRRLFLEQAFAAIRDAESDEARLLEHFNNYTLLTHEARQHPIVVSRTHRYIYVAPVACRKLKHVAYYKIHAKEKGSGTEVSIYNTDLPGSQRRVAIQSMTNFRDSVVRIGPLRNGELYMFGSVGYNAQDTIVGGVSPSTMAVCAVNPLPTVLLWSLLGQTAQTLQEPRISMDASWRVCCRFFQSMPVREPFSISSGKNLFVYDEPVICSLAVQQSTPVILHHFVASLLRYESLHYQEEHFGMQTNWNYRKVVQLRYLMAFERLGAVASIVASIQNQDLTVQLLLLSELLLDEMLRYDMVHLSRKLQPAVMSLLLCLQRISKRYWHDAEHRLYYKFCVTLVQVAMLNKSLTPVVSILNEFFAEARDKSISSLVYPSANVVQELGGLIRYADIVLGDSTKAALLNDAKLLLSSDQYKKNAHEGMDHVHDFWKLPDTMRYFKLSKTAKDLLSPPATPSADLQEMEKALVQEQPVHFSDYLSVIVQMMQELHHLEEYASLAKVLLKFPICKDYLAPDIQTSHENWAMTLCISLDKLVEMKTAAAQPVAAAAGGKKAPPPKKGAAVPEVEPTPAIDWSKVPDRYSQPTEDEIRKQRAQIGEIVYLLAIAHEKTRGAVNVFVRSHRGMLKRIVPDQELIRNETKRPLPLATSGLEITGEDVVARLAWSVALFTQAGMTESACNALLRLWNYLVAEYVDPNQFVSTFSSLESKMTSLLTVVTELIEKIGLTPPSFTGTLSGSVTGVDIDTLKLLETPVEPSTYQQRDILILFRAILHPLIYTVKVQWLYHEHPEETVLLCSRVFQVFAKYDPSNCLKLFCEELWSLVTEAQQTLIHQATEKVNEAKQNLEKYVFDYEEAQRKKRKKKLRIARTEKDEEELIFEAEKAKLEEIVTQAETKLAERGVEMEEVQNKFTFFQETLTKGAQLTHATKEKLFAFISHLGRRYGSGLDWRRLLSVGVSDDEILSMFADLRKSFERTARFLREKKERLLLVEVLEDYTNVLIRFGLFVDVEQYLNDVVDGLFNAMDACMNWKTVMQEAFQPDFDLTLIPGFPFVMSALGKLSKYCALNDYDRKSGYARMSSEMAMLMFQESIGHPVTKLGMAGYECVDLGGYNAISPYVHHSWFQAIEEHVLVLFTEAAYLDILPLVVLGEHLAAVYLRNMRLWLQMRIHRIRALIRQRLFSEAIAMYTGIRPTLDKMSKHVYGDILRQTKASDTANTAAYDASANDLNYFGKPCVFYNNLLPGDEKFNTKALEWMTTAPAELETFLSSFTVVVPESDLSPEQRQRMEEEKKAKADAEAAAAASNKKGAKPPAKGAAPVTEEQPPAYDGPRVPIFSQSQIVQMYLLAGQLFAEISTIDAHLVPKHALVADKWATKASLLLQQAKEFLFTRFTDATKQVDIAEFFLRILQQPEADVDVNDANERGSAESKTTASPRISALSDANQELYAHYFLRVMRTDKEWLYCYRETFACEQSLFLYRRKYRELLAGVTRLGKLFAHPLFQQFSSGDQQFQLMQFWFQCKWYQVLALEGQANRPAVIACITEAILPCCQAMQASHWQRCFLYQRASAHRVLKDVSLASKDMDQVLSSFTEQHDLESVALVQALILRAALLQEELQRLSGSDNKTCLESYHKHQKTLQLLRRAAEVGQRLGVQSGMFTPDTNVTFQLQPLDYQYLQSETSKQETFSGAVSGYHLLNPALYAFTDIHDNAPPLSITAAEAAENPDKTHHTPWQRLRLGPVDTIQSTSASITSPTEETAFISVHPANVFCNIYLKESRVLLLAQMALLQLLDDVRNKDIHRLRHITRQHKVKPTQNPAVAEDDDETGPFDPKLLQMEEVYLVEYVLKLMRQVVFVSPVMRARAYYFAARARMSSNNPQGYADLRAFEPATQAGSIATPSSPIPPILMQVQLTPIVAAMKLLTHARATHVWSLLKRLCLEVVRYFGQGGVAEAVEEQGVGNKHEVLRQAAQYLLLACQISGQRSKLRHGISDLVDSGAELNVALTHESLTQWTTQCFTSSLSPPVPSPAEIAASQAAAAAAAAASAPPAGKGGKAAPPATKGTTPATASTTPTSTTLTGRDTIALLVTCLREQAELTDVRMDATEAERWVEDPPAVSLSLDVHLLLQQCYPSSYGAQCALTTGHLPTGDLLPLVAAQSALQGTSSISTSTSTTVTQPIAAGSVTAVWDSLVCTPEEWVKMHSDVVTGKWFTLDASYGLYSHAALYLLLGDHVPISLTPAAPVAIAAPPVKGGKAPAGAANNNNATPATPALATDSKDPVLTRIVLYKGDVDHCERRLRQLAFDLQYPRDASAVTGDTVSQKEGQRFFATPSPSYFASLVWAVFTLLKRGFVGDEYWTQVATQYDHVSSLHNLTPVVHAGDWDTSSLTFHATPETTAPPPVSPRSAAAPASPRLQTLQNMQTPTKPPPPLTGTVILQRPASDLMGLTLDQPTVIIHLPYTVQSVKQLADIFNRSRDQAMVSQPEIGNFLRMALGYSAPIVSARAK